MDSRVLRAAINLAQAGRKDDARLLLMKILEEDVDNEVAYFWFVDTLPTNEDRYRALEIFQRRHPENERARMALQALWSQMPSEAIPHPATEILAQSMRDTSLVAEVQTGENILQPAVAEPPPTPTLQPSTDGVQPVFSDAKFSANEAQPSDTSGSQTEAGAQPVDTAAQPAAVDSQASPPVIQGADRIDELFPMPPIIDTTNTTFLPDETYTTRAHRQVQQVQKKQNPLATILIAAAIMITILGCGGYVLYSLFKDNPIFMSPAKKYAMNMDPVLVRIHDWQTGPMSDWDKAMASPVYEGQSTTYKDLFQLSQSMGASNILVSRELSPIAKNISVGAYQIDAMITPITPPTEIAAAHNQVRDCVRYTEDWAAMIDAFLENSVAVQEVENPCTWYSEAYDQLDQYVKAHK